MLKATKSFESLLIPQLPRSPPDVEAMRIYLILSECPALHDSKNYIRLTIPLAMAILRLDANPSKVLGITHWPYFLFIFFYSFIKSVMDGKNKLKKLMFGLLEKFVKNVKKHLKY